MTGRLRALPNKPIVLRNATCPYCGKALNRDNTVPEHVIGRRFVPRGWLDRRWTLIVRACKEPCNSRKGQLEDDLSAISMQPSLVDGYVRPDAQFIAEARRKGQGSFSTRTGKPVAKSTESIKIEASLQPRVRLTATLRAQPQAEAERVFELARFHCSAFFYFVTFNEKSRTGGFWPGTFAPLLFSFRSDWGNDVQRAFIVAVVGWEPRFIGGTADGMFKAVIRRHPSAECWSWALEWNENIRIVGFFGDFDAASAVVVGFPNLHMAMIPQPDGSNIGIRTETPLPPQEDLMFGWEDEEISPT